VYDDADRHVQTTKAYQWDGTTENISTQVDTYDSAGFLTSTVEGNTAAGGDGQDRLTTTYTYLDNGQVHTMAAGGRTTTFSYDPVGNITNQMVTGTDGLDGSSTTSETTTVYNAAGLPTETRVANGTGELVTLTGYDERGLATSVTSPRGSEPGADPDEYTTLTTYDVLGQPTRTELAPIDVAYSTDPSGGIEGSWTTDTVRPTSEFGYDAFGNQTHTVDANANTMVTAFDDVDRRVRVTHPSYTPPGGTPVSASEKWAYTPNGNVETYTDRAGEVTTYEYDDANQVVRTTEAAIPTPGMDAVAQAAGVTEQFYDWAGRLTRTVDAEGGVVEYAYDTFDRLRTTTTTVRAVADQPALTTAVSTDYSWLGFQTSTDDTATTIASTFSSLGEVLTETVGTLDPTSYTYDGVGRLRRTTQPDGTSSTYTYDQAGRQLTATMADSDGATVSVESYAYDLDGNQTAVTSPRGFDTTYVYDAVGWLASVTLPVDGPSSITTSYTYDRAGNPTSYTDGDGHVYRYAYNAYNLRSHVLEPPATAADEPETDRAYVTAFDTAGRPVAEFQPGGREVLREFNAFGLVEAEMWTEPGDTQAVGKEYGYDRLGRTAWGSHPETPLGYTYDDRGLLVAADGGAGETRTVYDTAGREVNRSDQSGSQTITYDANSQIDSITHAGSGTLAPTKKVTVRAASAAGQPTFGLSVDRVPTGGDRTVADDTGAWQLEEALVDRLVAEDQGEVVESRI
jgi:YD repeat-containing protein